MNDEEMLKFVSNFNWTFAKTYADRCPHEYIIKTKIDSVFFSAFEDIVDYIRKEGFDANFFQNSYKYYILGENYYWTMGEPIKDTIVLNRAKLSDYKLVDNSWEWKKPIQSKAVVR
jgi:hypothetical protein